MCFLSSKFKPVEKTKQIKLNSPIDRTLFYSKLWEVIHEFEEEIKNEAYPFCFEVSIKNIEIN